MLTMNFKANALTVMTESQENEIIELKIKTNLIKSWYKQIKPQAKILNRCSEVLLLNLEAKIRCVFDDNKGIILLISS